MHGHTDLRFTKVISNILNNCFADQHRTVSVACSKHLCTLDAFFKV